MVLMNRALARYTPRDSSPNCISFDGPVQKIMQPDGFDAPAGFLGALESSTTVTDLAGSVNCGLDSFPG